MTDSTRRWSSLLVGGSIAAFAGWLLMAQPLPAARAAAAAALPLHHIKLPAGFRIQIYAASVPNARSLALSPDGTLFVGTRDEGRVFAVLDRNRDGRADEVITIASDLQMPNGVAFREGSLYVAEVSRILRYDGIESRLGAPPKPVVITDSLPTEQHHGWKFIAFGPDGYLYVPVGAPCNVCAPKDPRFASITRMRPDGSGFEIFAHGVRNSVGFDWHPVTRELWFTDNGRDMMGDDIPPCELNHATQTKQHFGFPHCHGGSIADPEFASRPCTDFRGPVHALGAHVAPLGMRFYTGRMFPQEFHNQIFVAEHGSWNRSSKVGYRLMVATLEGNRVVKYEPFATGWLQGEEEWGRPVDVLLMPDGALLVSDDFAGAIYRITYEGR